jgi:A/G-specific adenine glycosylase
MERFPDVGALADAPLDDVLKAWEGLGYYARARNLHRAALQVRDRMDGALPTRASELRDLPGFGEYTSGAVASIAFGEVVPAVDGNVRRVLARLFDEAEPTARWLRERAAALVDPERPGDFNQALMELGATVCTPRRPECNRCPLRAECVARDRGTVAERPRPRRRAGVPDVEIAVAALVRRGSIARGGGPGEIEMLIVRRPDEGLLGGMWELPGLEVGADGPERAAARAATGCGIATVGTGTSLPVVKHAFSHFRGIYRPFLWELASKSTHTRAGADGATGAAPRSVWVDAEGLAARALPRAQRRIVEHALGAAGVALSRRAATSS